MARLMGLSMKRPGPRALRLATCAIFATAALAAAASAAQPRPWELGMQPPATLVKERLSGFHDELLVIIFLISGFVMALLLYVMVRFSHLRNPVPSRTTHNPLIEIAWTVIPVLILITIAIPSFKLMYYMAEIPTPALTVTATGHQWYWTYTYPDQGGLTFDSNVIADADLKPGQKRLLDVDNPLVVPAGENVELQVTSTDVIHSWFVPSFGVQEYAIIGRINKSWFNILQPGTYYGECNQICGVNHGYMPIKVVAISKDAFRHWLVDAKKKFVSNHGGEPVHLAAATAGAARPAAAGN
jgi:cytochrome c oxidase subunit II